MNIHHFRAGLAALIALFLLNACKTGEKKIIQARQDTTAATRPMPVAVDTYTYVRMSFAGDIMMHQPQIRSAWVDSLNGYDLDAVFAPVAPYIQKADIAVANLETTFGGEPFTGYPQFSAPDTLAWALKRAGFDVIVTANNHTADRSLKGIIGTIKGLEAAGLPHTGSFRSQAERDSAYPLMMEKNGIRIAMLNYTYGTNGLPVLKPTLVNFIDTAEIAADIAEARKRKAEAIIAVFHWGIEYQREPNAEQKEIAKYCLRHGVTAVIGGHPHVLQPAVWESYTLSGDSLERKGLVLYSLGNFVSNQRDRYKDGGILFNLTIRKNKLTSAIDVQDVAIVPIWVYKKYQPVLYKILPAAKFKEDTATIPLAKDREQMEEFLEDTRKHMLREGIQEVKD